MPDCKTWSRSVCSPWDAGSARVLSGPGFEALAGFKGTFGYLDRSMTTPELNAFMQG